MSLILRAPQPRRFSHAHPERVLALESLMSYNELADLAQQLSTPEVILKPKELHLAFNWGILHSNKYSRFRRIKLPASRPRYGPNPSLLRMSTVSSTMTIHGDAAVLITRPIRRESTYIVWGAVMSVDAPTRTAVPPRNVLVKVAVDEEGGEDLREDARLHEQLVERGLTQGYYGLFVDSIGSTALVTDDFDGEMGKVEIPSPSFDSSSSSSSQTSSSLPSSPSSSSSSS